MILNISQCMSAIFKELLLKTKAASIYDLPLHKQDVVDT